MQICFNAIFNNHFELFKWAYENGAPLDYSGYNLGIEGKNQQIIKYLKENICSIINNI